ncbi:porin [Candidatus Symbiobacter mobilis]|uniref:Outer membrane protein n=1 Tax=Candidatus Symbiobacter mobilis CR TaxID=946483 RepID=U5N7Z6_9BURK|nr:porin [Candidatus Symbiobacter mobilis]AGX87681.1 outer membrane protein [Candidatus Symbiobacter mobilis CR]
MKKSLIALAALAATGATFAQSSVNVYGIVDGYFGATKNDADPKTLGATQTVIQSGGVNSSRIGFKGVEDLGSGLKANFVLEQGFNVDDGGATAGQAFSRKAYVGLTGGFGEIRLGKPYTAYDDIVGTANSVFDSKLAPTTNVWISSDAYLANPGNTVYYAMPSLAGFTGAISLSFGEDKTTKLDPSSVTSLNLQYADGPLYAAVGYQTEEPQGVNVVSTDYTTVQASYDFGIVKVLGSYGSVDDGNTTDEWQFGIDYPVSSALVLSAGFARSTDDDAADTTRTGYGLGAAYSLSKRTTVYGGYRFAAEEKNGRAEDVENSTFAVGVNHKF